MNRYEDPEPMLGSETISEGPQLAPVSVSATGSVLACGIGTHGNSN
jgi:hypothetical protein